MSNKTITTKNPTLKIPYESPDDLELEKYLFSFTILSLCFSSFFLFIHNAKFSSYAKIIRHVVVAEAICQFSLAMFILESIHWSFWRETSARIFNFFTYDLFIANHSEEIEKILIKVNSSIFYAMETTSMILSSFICLEIILVLKNPIKNMKNRLKIYFSFVNMMGIAVFLLVFINKDFDLDFEGEGLNKICKKIFNSEIGR